MEICAQMTVIEKYYYVPRITGSDYIANVLRFTAAAPYQNALLFCVENI